jgi:hypothetical protein
MSAHDRAATRRHASACAALIPTGAATFTEDRAVFSDAFEALIAVIRAADDRFAFDLEGRPGAIAAIRGALPAIESELLDAVLDDVACEIAARQEALYQVALACRDGSR